MPEERAAVNHSANNQSTVAATDGHVLDLLGRRLDEKGYPLDTRGRRIAHYEREGVRFLRRLDPKGVWTLKALRPAINPEAKRATDSETAHFVDLSKSKTQRAMVEWIRDHGRYDIYFFVNEFAPEVVAATEYVRLDRSHIGMLRGCQIDIDPRKDHDFTEERDRLRSLMDTLQSDREMNRDHPPTITVSSGGGVQAFWFFKGKLPATDENKLAVYTTSVGLRDAFDGADNVQDIARVMRLPGTVNWQHGKKAGRPIIHAEILTAGDRVPDPTALAEVFPPKGPVDAQSVNGSTDAGDPTEHVDNSEKDNAALDHAKAIIAARKAGELPTGFDDVVARIKADAPALLEPYDTALVDASDARLDAARILLTLRPAATVLDFAGLLAMLPGVGEWKPGTGGAGGGVFNDRSIGRDWHRVTAEERPTVSGAGFGAVDDEPAGAAVALVAAWVVFEAAAKAGATPDAEALTAAVKAAGASAVTVAGVHALAQQIDPVLSSDGEIAKALAEIDRTVAKLVKKAGKVDGEGKAKKQAVVVKSGADFIREYRPMKTRVGKSIREGYLYTLSGKTGHGKTSFMIALALALAFGRSELIGVPVKQCRVVYATFENPDDFRVKLAGACSRHGVDLDELCGRLDVIDASTSPEILKEAVASIGDVGCLVIDTLQAAFDGKEFNANEEVLRFVRRLRPITRLPSLPTVIVPAHPNKAIDKPEDLVPYGGGSIMNEVDGNLTLWRDAAGVMTFSFNKLRGPNFAPLKYKIDAPTFNDIRDDDGDPMEIPIAVPITTEEAARDEVKVRSATEEVLLAVVAEPEGNTRTWGEKIGRSKTAVATHLRALAADKLVKQDARGRWVATTKGEEMAAAILRRETGGFGPVDDDEEAPD